MGDGRDTRDKQVISGDADADRVAEKFLDELLGPPKSGDSGAGAKPAALRPEEQSRLDQLSNNHELADKFPPPTAEKMRGLRTELDKELTSEVPVMGDDGKPTNLYDKIMRSDKLDAAQKERILDALAEVKDAYYRIEAAVPADADAKGYQDVNWKHTRAEVDQVLDSAGKMGLSPVETENALFASIFSDSVKFAKGDPNNKPNFLVHNVDGAKAAAEVLPRYFDPSIPGNLERIESITRAVLEHQVAPPEFMSGIARLALEGRLGKTKDNPLPAEQQALVDSIVEKIKKPVESPHVTDSNGASRIAFTDAERGLLKQIGVEEWFVPNVNNAWNKTSQAVINGDSLINYASPDGWAKIAAIRGPGKEPWFWDKTVFDSLESTQKSYDDAYSMLSAETKPLAEAGLKRTRGAIDRVKGEMELWFKELESKGFEIPRTPDGKIAFWDAPLKYATKDQPLNELEQRQFAFAKQIREEMVRRLRAQQGVFESSPTVAPVVETERKVDGTESGQERSEKKAETNKSAADRPTVDPVTAEKVAGAKPSADKATSDKVGARAHEGEQAAKPTAAGEETSEFYDSQGPTRGRDSVLKVETTEGAGGVTMVSDKASAVELAKTLEKYKSDEAFQGLLEKEIAEAKDEKERERLREQLEKYRQLSESERARVRDLAAEDAVRGSGGAGRAIGRVLAIGGTIIAVGMLADVLLSHCGSNNRRSGPPITPTYRAD